MTHNSPTPSRRPIAALLTAFRVLLLPMATGPLIAQYGFTGISSVRATYMPNRDLPFYPVEAGDSFGDSLAAGDFNCDGVQDLAIGAAFDDGPSEDPRRDAGAVTVRWGAAGLAPGSSAPDTMLNQFAFGSPDTAETLDRFGMRLAVGDFDFNGCDDLVVGTPFDHENADTSKGSVQIFYGHLGSIDLAGEQYLQLGRGGLPGPDVNEDSFGGALAVGDFNGDFYDDVAIGASGATIAGHDNAGAAVVLHGSNLGLDPGNSYLITQNEWSIPDDVEEYDHFGSALTAGNFNGDYACQSFFCVEIDDLAIGVPGEDSVGAVLVLMGSSNSLLFDVNSWLGQGDVGGFNEAEDWFGGSLAAADLDGDYADELVVAAPFEDTELNGGGVVHDAGEITVLFGRLTAAAPWFDLGRTQRWREGTLFGQEQETEGPFRERFGSVMTAGDFSRSGREDLVVGCPAASTFGDRRGEVYVLRWAQGTGSLEGARMIVTGAAGIPPAPGQTVELFGTALTSGDFDGDFHSDLVIGIPLRHVGAIHGAGGVTLLIGSLFADGFETGGTLAW